MTATTATPRAFVDALNHDYERIHTAKEDAFWRAYMGLAADADGARRELSEKEIALNAFLADPARLAAVRREIERAEAAIDAPDEASRPDADTLQSLTGWLATLASHVVDDAQASAMSETLVAAEGELANARGRLELSYSDTSGARIEAGSVKVATLLGTDPNEGVRRSCFEALRSIERHVLESGFLDVVARRNALARRLGASDYYAWKLERVEGMTKADVFARLDELEARTRDRARAGLDALVRERGASAREPWNVRYFVAGDVTREQDPYFPFARALERWMRSFEALSIRYRGATLVLDLVDRKGKYENGFMHGPVPAWREHGAWRPARIHFTANALPGQIGAGRRALETLFHEGGHAAHFANIDMPSPCFSQEFAPTSVAFAETQSMFCDSFLGDADWQARYARTSGGERMSDALIEKGITTSQPFAAWNQRMMLCVPFAERAIYELADHELTAERVLGALRDVERRLLFLDGGSPRPVLSVPHLLSGESSAYYHGYVLAEMAVQQTRAHFREHDGFLLDNPRVGPTLEDAYWRPGNSLTFLDFVENLTGKPLGAGDLAHEVNRTADEALRDARAEIAREPSIPLSRVPIALDARVRVVHGTQEIADSARDGFEGACERFEAWIGTLANA